MCYLSITGRILQCHEGHVICVTCYYKIDGICPICRSKNTSSHGGGGIPIRNLALEKLSSSLYVPCHNQANGCRSILSFRDKSQHELTCVYRELPCLASIMSARFSDCTWTGQVHECVSSLLVWFNRHIITPMIRIVWVSYISCCLDSNGNVYIYISKVDKYESSTYRIIFIILIVSIFLV